MTARERVAHLLKAWPKIYPRAHCELDFRNPLQLLVATILSAQSTDKRVNMVTPSLFRKYRTAKDYADAPLPELENAIKSTGFYRNKAKSIRGAMREIVEKHGGKVPETMEELCVLPGVGRKTANVVLGNAFHIDEGIVVDTHVIRLSQRLALTKQKDPVKIELDLMKLVPREHWTDWSHWLIWHGRRRCYARKPDCSRCEVFKLCPSGKIFLRTGKALRPRERRLPSRRGRDGWEAVTPCLRKCLNLCVAMAKIAHHLRRFAIAVLILLAGSAFAATEAPKLQQLREQLKKAQDAEDKPAIIELSRRIVAIAPNDSGTWDTLAQTQVESDDLDGLERTLDAWQKAVRRPTAAIEDFRAGLCFKRKDYQCAEQHWLAFIATKPPRTDVATDYDNLAELCAAQERWADHAAYRTKAIAAQDTAARRVLRAVAFLRLHNWDAAYADMAKANKMDATNPQVKAWLPEFERLQKFLPQIKPLDTQITKSPNDVALLLERARVLILAGRPALAIDDAERAFKLQPASMRARIELAEALLDAGQPRTRESWRSTDIFVVERTSSPRRVRPWRTR